MDSLWGILTIHPQKKKLPLTGNSDFNGKDMKIEVVCQVPAPRVQVHLLACTEFFESLYKFRTLGWNWQASFHRLFPRPLRS
jgi:hypothetical protein